MQIAFLKVDEPFIFVSSKYINFADVFSKNLVIKLVKYIRINNHTIKFIKTQQPLYVQIYSLRPVKLKILKIYIET